MKRALLIIPFLAACASAPESASLASCGGEPLADLVGVPYAQAQPRIPEGARVIQPGTPVTQDLRPDRLNITMDSNAVVTRVWCG